MTYRILVTNKGKRIMVKSLTSGMDVIEFICKCGKEGMEAVLL